MITDSLSSLSQPAKEWLRTACHCSADGQGYPPNKQLRKECAAAGLLTIKRGGYIEFPAPHAEQHRRRPRATNLETAAERGQVEGTKPDVLRRGASDGKPVDARNAP